MNNIFVDTWAWYALADKTDISHHLVATETEKLLDADYRFTTTNYVLYETLTLVRYKMSHALTMKLWNSIQSLEKTGLLTIIRINEKQEQNAQDIFKHYNDQKFSIVDCTSFAVMQDLKLQTAFSGDKHFSIMGFTCIP